jgi:hypothetical protein
MKVFLAIALLAAPTTAQMYNFDNQMYHAEDVQTTECPFENLEIFVLNGEYDIGKGGSVTVTNANSTFADSSIGLTPQYKLQPQSLEWESNATVTLTKKSGGNATIFGKVLFLQSGGKSLPREIYWYSGTSTARYICGIWAAGE